MLLSSTVSDFDTYFQLDQVQRLKTWRMSFDQGAPASFFRITYDPVASPAEFLAAPAVNENSVFNGSSIKIIRAKSFHIHRCRTLALNIHGEDEGIFENERKLCCCTQNEKGELSHSNQAFGEMFSDAMLLALLISPTLTRSFIDAVQSPENKRNQSKAHHLVSDDVDQSLKDESNFRKSIHPCLCNSGPYYTIHNCTTLKNGNLNEPDNQDLVLLPRMSIYGIITADRDSILPADVVLFELNESSLKASITHTDTRSHHIARHIARYSSLLNHETASDAPWSVLKAFPVCSIAFIRDSFVTKEVSTTNELADNAQMKSINQKYVENSALPCCPVCLHRIDPKTLGLPGLKHHQKCSRRCSTPINPGDSMRASTQYSCKNEMKLEPWPPPARCNACLVICQRNSSLRVESSSDAFGLSSFVHGPSTCLKCHECGITRTLWVCLTCGVVGCGRYTLKHAADHFTSSGHPYSLELATMRIWDYENGSFVHRRDLLECPVLSMKWCNDSGKSDSIQSISPLIASAPSMGSSTCQDDSELNLESSFQRHGKNEDKLSPPSKKSTMVSQEYEALLQSALEDQAMHFEGEISHLRAELASSRIKHFEKISDREARQIKALRNDSERLKQEIEILSSALLEMQAEESKDRALSQKLLREKSISKELLDQLQKDIGSEHELCKMRMDDLDLQIEDLTANLRMRTRIARNEELSHAQIFGTADVVVDYDNKKKAKKSSRLGRKK
eukprot:CCRYP_021147-RA/>CCRYP_021147-RA protein AED:0.02 eAED:0.02 QI:68/0/0.5/1/0/0/2/0/734